MLHPNCGEAKGVSPEEGPDLNFYSAPRLQSGNCSVMRVGGQSFPIMTSNDAFRDLCWEENSVVNDMVI